MFSKVYFCYGKEVDINKRSESNARCVKTYPSQLG